jgi:uncharacterized protein
MLFITHHEPRACPGQDVDAARRSERVILFGSRARGDHDADSDWDLCVLLNDDIPPGRYTPGFLWEAVRDLGASIQVVPMRRSVFEATRRDGNALGATPAARSARTRGCRVPRPSGRREGRRSGLVAEGIRYPRGRGAGPDPDALTRLIPIANPFHEQARPLAGLTPWATAFH